MIVNSQALQTREREADDQGARALAGVIAGSAQPRTEDMITAYALVGVHRVLVDYTREQILAGVRGNLLTRRVNAQARRGLAMLAAGLPE